MNVCIPQKHLSIDRPYIVGYMSVDVHRHYHHNLSQLKFLNSIPTTKLYYDLNHNIEKAIKRTTDNDDEKISLLLKFLLHQKHRFKFWKSLNTTAFITYRRTLISVMMNTNNHEPVSIVASLFNNCIYLCSLEKPRGYDRNNLSDQRARFTAWGYKFEQYMLSDTPRVLPNTNKPVIENEEFSLYYVSQLGKHRLFYGAQIDGMLATSTTLDPPADSNDSEAILNYLRKNEYVELKTNKEIYNRRQEQIFKRYKMMHCWCQCYLAGLKGLLVGYRSDSGIIQRVQWFTTDDIVRVSGIHKQLWNICTIF